MSVGHVEYTPNYELFNSFYQIFRIWYWEHCTEGMTTEGFLRRLKKWEHAGFIHSDVWSNMDDIVASDVRRSIETGASISTPDEFERLTEDAIINDRVLSRVSRFIVASRKSQFALEILRLEYQSVIKERHVFHRGEMKSNLEVCYQYNLFYVFCLVILQRYTIAYIVVPKVKVLNSKVKRSCVRSKCRISLTCLFKVCVYLSSDNDALA